MVGVPGTGGSPFFVLMRDTFSLPLLESYFSIRAQRSLQCDTAERESSPPPSSIFSPHNSDVLDAIGPSSVICTHFYTTSTSFRGPLDGRRETCVCVLFSSTEKGKGGP